MLDCSPTRRRDGNRCTASSRSSYNHANNDAKEYFANYCSATAKKKRKTIKVLSIVCLAIQAVLNILLILSLIATADLIHQLAGANTVGEGVTVLIITWLIFIVGTFAFTIGGMKKNSTGFLLLQRFSHLYLPHWVLMSLGAVHCVCWLSSEFWLST